MWLFVAGILFGTFSVVVTMSLMAAAKRADCRCELIHQEKAY